ncbi:isopenicillin N synthase family dioxygenase [Jannaschia marina]|uniref:isopenicillin N synthase family dioxygenase n=1 Tax=Jannaschia marina TaxID=2741674 RepID=UPI0015C97B97|nr:isopenicillin N synthase family oxygenase [Jannaschia marina]
MIPRVDAAALLAPDHPDHADARAAARAGAAEIGFLTVFNTAIAPATVAGVIDAYRAFFHLPAAEKRAVDMARTGANRGWGAPGSEQVNPAANPDYKQVFDCGLELAPTDPVAALDLPVYAPNLWPDHPAGFAPTLRAYYGEATAVALDLLCAIAEATGGDGTYFRERFSRPMALLRGNFYPARPADATAKDFGIAAHTDYGCLTLLATDGAPGLEVERRGGGWIPVTAPVGEFVINFGEMLEIWTEGRIRATPHRVKGPSSERISVPLFLNPNHDAIVSPPGAAPMRAVDHLQARFSETYVHLQAGAT